jgi:phage replication initiation protein
VDWLNVTWLHDRTVVELCAALSGLMGDRPVVAEAMSGGLHGFEHGQRLLAYGQGQLVPFAKFSWGGEAQRGRCYLSIEGGGCRLIEDWHAVRAFLEELPGVRLTRTDLAVDLHDGDYTVDDCASWAMEGRLNNGGRPPKLDTQGDWLTKEYGRTLYVGQAKNGKMLRCYEKGKQLGDLESPWVRFEVQFGSQDRELPLAMLTDRDAYFAAAYPALQEVLGIVGEKIKTTRETTRLSLSKAIEHLHRSYGKWINFAVSQGVESADLVEAVRVRAVPSRLNLASLADAGLSATVHAVISERNFANETASGEGDRSGLHAYRVQE